MRLAGNLIWALCGGLISAVCWTAAGLAWCITIVGIPVGAQCFKYAYLTLMPFGKDVTYCGGPVSFLLNAAWLLLSGIWLAAVNAILGALLTLTVIGIPFGKQFFKIAKLALAPFGTRVS